MTVNAGPRPADERVIRVSTTADRLKGRQIRVNPRVALHVDGPGLAPDRRLTITFPATRLYGTALDVPR
jgi:hypothetical protein